MRRARRVSEKLKLTIVNSQASFRVDDVQSFGGYVLHVGHFAEGGTPLSVGDLVEMHVDRERRGIIMSNHTSTHMVNLALRSVLGEGVDQRGSLVDHNRFRFDFSHGKPVTGQQLAELDRIVRELITKELPVYTKIVTLSEAKKIKGLRAVFGEVYPDPVR
jgi:alanyl-tRNA synthetase